MFDVFFSYAHVDQARVRPPVAALKDRGLRVWFDEQDVDPFSGITDRVADGIAGSKVVVAFYSVSYPQRRPCQWELTLAFLTAQGSEDPRRRVLVVNPEPDETHIYPVELRDALFQRAPDPADPLALAQVVDAVESHVAKVKEPLGSIGAATAPRWYPAGAAVGSTRFVGRLNEMWRIHSALHAGDAGLITGASGPAVAQVRGLGGIGKTLLAQEYATRFGATYPGGVIWLQLYGEDKRTYLYQLHRLAAALGVIPAERRGTADVLDAVAGELERRGKPYLWILDDVPERFTIDGLRELLPPHPIARTLFTTRSRTLDAVAPPVDLDVLPTQDAVALLTARRKPADDREWGAARKIAEALGGHALALDVAGSALHKRERLQTFAQFLVALDRPDRDEFEVTAELADALPSSREKNIIRLLRRSIDLLDGAGRDFLDLAAMLESAPIPADLVADTFAHNKALDADAAADLAARGLDDAASLSLAAPTEQAKGCWRVHVLVSRTQRLQGAGGGSSVRLRLAAIEALGSRRDSATERPPRATDAYEIAHAERLASLARDPLELNLLAAIGRYHASRGNSWAARKAFSRQADASRDLLGSEAPETLAAETGQAEALFALEWVEEAEALHRHVFEVRERTLGPRHPDTLTSMERLAEIALEDGRLAEAGRMLDHVAAIREQVLGPDHPATMRAIRLQASRMIRGGKREGIILLYLILTRQESTLGREHPETLASLELSAQILEKTGETSAASERLERVIVGRRRTLGEDHRYNSRRPLARFPTHAAG